MSNGGTRLEIANAKEVIDTYTKLPININSEIKKALRQAAKPAIAEVKASVDQKSRKSVQSKIYGKDGINLMIGLFQAKAKSPDDPYFKQYWKEYGTLAKRSTSHSFKFARKPITKSWRGGITAQNRLSPLLDQKIPQIIDRVDKILKEKNIDIK